MSNDVAHAADGVGVNARASLAESPRGTTLWRVDRWDAEATAWAQKRLAHERGGGWLSRSMAPGERFDDPWPLLRVEVQDFAHLRIRPYETSEVVGNVVTTAGWTRASNLLTNQGATQALDATHTRIGAGDGAGTAAAGDTDLSASAGSTHRWFQLVGGVGTVSTNTLAFTATFASADGNFAWNEFGIDVGATASSNAVAALLYNHKTSIAQGTKASGQTWAITATVTFT